MYPILFTIPIIDLPIYSYGVMLGLSLVVGWYLIMFLGKRDGLPPDKLASCFIWTVVAAILGARFLYIVTNFGDYQDANLIDMLNLRKGGLVAYGGFIGGTLGSWIYLKKHGMHLLPWADCVAPTLCSGLGITRIGCFLYGCDYGVPIGENAPGWIKAIGLSFPSWSVRFPKLTEQFEQGIGCMSGTFGGSPAFIHHVDQGLVTLADSASMSVYPTQLMEVANGWLAFIIVMLVRKHTKFRGQAFLTFIAYYGVTRTLMEIIRGDTQRGGIGTVSTSQIVGIVTFLIAAAVWFVLAKRAKKDPEAAMSLGPGARPKKTDDEETSNLKRVKSRRKKKK
jgi:phosphatidylglycerol:prolipoprotein diacylglycerol transferase